jgi:hypothetical protein
MFCGLSAFPLRGLEGIEREELESLLAKLELSE